MTCELMFGICNTFTQVGRWERNRIAASKCYKKKKVLNIIAARASRDTDIDDDNDDASLELSEKSHALSWSKKKKGGIIPAGSQKGRPRKYSSDSSSVALLFYTSHEFNIHIVHHTNTNATHKETHHTPLILLSRRFSCSLESFKHTTGYILFVGLIHAEPTTTKAARRGYPAFVAPISSSTSRLFCSRLVSFRRVRSCSDRVNQGISERYAHHCRTEKYASNRNRQ